MEIPIRALGLAQMLGQPPVNFRLQGYEAATAAGGAGGPLSGRGWVGDAEAVALGIHPIVTLEKQPLNMTGNLV